MQDSRINKFRKVIGNYLSGKATATEEEAVEAYYELFGDEPDVTDRMDADEIAALDARMKSRIILGMKTEEAESIPLYRRGWFRIAAMLVLVAGIVVTIYRTQHTFHTVEQAKVINVKPIGGDQFVTLPDGSKVVLRDGSHLEYGTDFNKTSREVTLTGEAYFDVVHIDLSDNSSKLVSQPFIIHTGKIKTTVLGTAFEIKAWPEKKNVTVTVARGKVRVEDEKHILAVLTEDKQLSYNTETEQIGEKKVKAQEAIAWMEKDMTFDEIPLETLALLLEKRYQIKINFNNPDLKLCKITGRFFGTETLEEVFRILSVTSNTTFKIEANVLTIDGQACN